MWAKSIRGNEGTDGWWRLEDKLILPDTPLSVLLSQVCASTYWGMKALANFVTHYVVGKGFYSVAAQAVAACLISAKNNPKVASHPYESNSKATTQEPFGK